MKGPKHYPARIFLCNTNNNNRRLRNATTYQKHFKIILFPYVKKAAEYSATAMAKIANFENGQFTIVDVPGRQSHQVCTANIPRCLPHAITYPHETNHNINLHVALPLSLHVLM